MEIQRVAAASTFVSWPQLNSAGDPISGVTVAGQWMAWADTAGPSQQGNPGFRGLSGLIQELSNTGIYSVALATTELPAASPYVMLKFTNANTATQYILIRTSSFYANITGINGTNIVAPVTAGYMPVDVKQTISLSAPADNSIEKGLARAYAASNYADIRAISGTALAAPVTAGFMPIDVKQTISLSAPADNSIEKSLARSYMAATNYIDAAVSQGVLATTLNLTNPTDNTLGKALSRMYMAATNYIDAAVSQGVLATTLNLTAPADNTLGKALSRMYMAATNYIDAAISSGSGISLGTALNLTGGAADNSVGKVLSRLYYATQYLDTALSSLSSSIAGVQADTDDMQTRLPAALVGGRMDSSVGSNLDKTGYTAAPTAGSITTSSFAAGAINAAALAADGASAYADAFLGRTLTRGASGGRTVQQALQAIRNKVNLTSGTLTVYSNDDTAIEWTAAVATEGVSTIITQIDPT